MRFSRVGERGVQHNRTIEATPSKRGGPAKRGVQYRGVVPGGSAGCGGGAPPWCTSRCGSAGPEAHSAAPEGSSRGPARSGSAARGASAPTACRRRR
eukprot:819002-Prorocentrum_minimum.AAC.1